jgi:ribosomal protein S18 acetylase RimI-like enzyme
MHIVRLATEEDIVPMVTLAELSHREYARMSPQFQKPVSQEYWAERFKKSLDLPEYYALVCCPADNSQEILGYCEFLVKQSQVPYLKHEIRAVIDNIIVRQSERRKGIATKLIEVAEQYALMKGATVVELNVLSTNKEALNLYYKIGFRAQAVTMSKVFRPEE